MIAHFAREGGRADTPNFDILWSMDRFHHETHMPVVALMVGAASRIVNGDNTAASEERRPAFIGGSNACVRLITIQKEHVDRRSPMRRYLACTALVNFHPLAEASSPDVLIEALPERFFL